MRRLVLGGTRFVGRHIVEHALARGDDVTLFNRGLSAPDLFAGVALLRGDRAGDLRALRHGGPWDAAIDVTGLPAAGGGGELRRARRPRAAPHVHLDGAVYDDVSRPGVDVVRPDSSPAHTIRRTASAPGSHGWHAAAACSRRGAGMPAATHRRPQSGRVRARHNRGCGRGWRVQRDRRGPDVGEMLAAMSHRAARRL
jgi:hypothetical protein